MDLSRCPGLLLSLKIVKESSLSGACFNFVVSVLAQCTHPLSLTLSLSHTHMKSDVLGSLGSLGEVAVFAWSLLEMLITRIFPLLGFLTGHFLLHCFIFVAGISFSRPTAATVRPRRLPRRWVEYEQQQQDPAHGHLQAFKSVASTQYSIDGILNEYELQEQQAPSPEVELGPDVQPLPTAEQQVKETVPPSDVQRDESVNVKLEEHAAHVVEHQKVHSNCIPTSKLDSSIDSSRVERALLEQSIGMPAGTKDPINEGQVEKGEPALADSVLKSGGFIPGCLNGMPSIPEEDEPIGDSQVGESGPLGREDSVGSRPSDGETDAGLKKSGSTRKGSGMKLPRVLPPSLSQIKRTLMQRSRRSWSPASATDFSKATRTN
ncbi:hypothetical protein GOP47_0004548 [Adiantum capillus-veneris]|uniref:Uncharacterized protein n=1 Tax=Adiantum capillus-veneris TaxID=13818 RepID=A0A9D4V8G1_ADICA|nr:hypothetical protein GOP47_0004548 [Adiantum capillus-veneris]